jgi:hypothetical protein
MSTGFDAIDALPHLNEFKNERDLPSTPVAGVYFLQNETGVVYVGQSGHIRRRLAQHRAEGRKQFHDALYYPIEDQMSRLLTEAILTLALRPVYNDAVLIGLKNPIGGGPRVWEWNRARVYRKSSRSGGKRGRR